MHNLKGSPTAKLSANPARSRMRTLHLIDLENLVGNPVASSNVVKRAWVMYREFGIGVAEGDHVIIATSSIMAKTAWFALPTADIQWRVHDGADGADRELLNAVDLAHDSTRFDRLAIASGDHYFTELALAARRAGMVVHQVIGVGTPSRELMAACQWRTWLHLTPGSGLDAYRARGFRSGHDLAA
jgi:hypothetical protein